MKLKSVLILIGLIKKLYESYDLFLFTTREKCLSEKWLKDNELGNYFKDVTNIKIPAYLYIDDRCIYFNGNYDKLLNDINKFNLYWK